MNGTVVYEAKVYVDIEDDQIVDVLVSDTSISEPQYALDEDCLTHLSPEESKALIEIAENRDWPAWRIGE